MAEQLKGRINSWHIAARADTAIDRGDGPTSGRSHHFEGFEEAVAHLRALDEDPLNETALRSVISSADSLRDLSLVDVDEARRLAAWMFEDRSLLQHRHDLDVLGGGGGGGEPVDPVDPVDPVAPVETWIEVHLKRVDGTPVTGERYKVKLPDGTEQEGTTNAAGAARIEHIIPGGICDWTFPDLDRRMFTRTGP